MGALGRDYHVVVNQDAKSKQDQNLLILLSFIIIHISYPKDSNKF